MEKASSRVFPRIVVAGTSSGAGKTSVTLALVSALRKRGLTVQTFKVGPDYLDPSYLALASDRPCYNLDGWMTGREYVCSLFAEKASTADVSVIEGVMGLFDGSDPAGPEGSTAEIAAWLDAPVLLVVNVHGMARSIAAVVKGFTELDPMVKISGVVANHCGSERHAAWLSDSLTAFGLPGTVGSIRRGSLPELPSRHLGLVTADSRNLSENVMAALGDALEHQGNVDEILRLARCASDIDQSLAEQLGPVDDHRVRLAVAHDAAFHFYYPDNLEALQAGGCELIPFSPIADASLPERLDGIYIGGGYPEEHAAALAENRPMRESIRRFAESGKTLYAECGGLMYLSQGIQALDGWRFPMVGLVPGWTRMLSRRKSLGYVEVTLTADSIMGVCGTGLRGHEFHYSELIDDPAGSDGWNSVYLLRHRRSDTMIREGFQRGNTLASYVHVHFASRPCSVERFVSACSKASHRTKQSHG
jgi:cobyrinic acid a,c-diamide synthase